MTRTSPPSFYLFAVSLLAVGHAAASCHADNCYRALFPCSQAGQAAPFATATDFCATITQGPGKTATNYPAKATPACGTRPDRYVSACACGPTCFPTPTGAPPCPTPTGGNIVPNGDFECGITPWVVQVPDPAARYRVGGPANTGLNAFLVTLTGLPQYQEYGVDARITSQPLRVRRGVQYRLSYWTYFSDELCRPTFIGVMINGAALNTAGASDQSYGSYHYGETLYTPQTDTVRIRFEWVLGPDVCTAGIDTISMVPV